MNDDTDKGILVELCWQELQKNRYPCLGELYTIRNEYKLTEAESREYGNEEDFWNRNAVYLMLVLAMEGELEC